MDLTGWFSLEDQIALSNVIRRNIRENMIVVEIGSWKGLSTKTIVETIRSFNGVVYCVDHWLGNEGLRNDYHKEAMEKDVFSMFKSNMLELNLWKHICPMVMSSLDAAKIFADKSVDVVFLDGDHRYKKVLEDIRAWLPKIRNGGVICGHDCEGHFDDPRFKDLIILSNDEDDYINDFCHPGVIRAVTDTFGNKFNIEKGSTIWSSNLFPPRYFHYYFIKMGLVRIVGKRVMQAARHYCPVAIRPLAKKTFRKLKNIIRKNGSYI